MCQKIFHTVVMKLVALLQTMVVRQCDNAQHHAIDSLRGRCLIISTLAQCTCYKLMPSFYSSWRFFYNSTAMEFQLPELEHVMRQASSGGPTPANCIIPSVPASLCSRVLGSRP